MVRKSVSDSVRKFVWFVAIWAMSVMALGGVAMVIRWALRL